MVLSPFRLLQNQPRQRDKPWPVSDGKRCRWRDCQGRWPGILSKGAENMQELNEEIMEHPGTVIHFSYSFFIYSLLFIFAFLYRGNCCREQQDLPMAACKAAASQEERVYTA